MINIQKKNIILFFILLLTWIIGICNIYFFNITNQNQNYDSILMIIIINFFIILFWLLIIKIGYLDKIILNINNKLKYIKNNNIKFIINISIFIFIIFISIFIEKINCYITNNKSINNYKIYLYITVGFVFYFIIVLNKYPEKLFFHISITIGLLCILSFPPYVHTTWDEGIHYKRSVEQSYIKKVYLNNSIIKLSSSIPILYININLFDKNIRNDFLDDVNSKENTIITSSYNKKNNLYTHLAYIPAGLMIFIGRSLALKESNIFILGRIGIHFFYTLIVYFALRRLLSGKYILIVIALLPTIFYQSVTYTYDYWIIAFLMLGFSYFFYEIQNPLKKINIKNLIIMITSFILALSPKAIYFPLMIILYFLPPKKFDNIKKYKNYILIVTFFIFLIILSFILPLLYSKGDIFTDIRGGTNVSAAGQIKFILQNPKKYAIILFNFLKNYLNIFKEQNYFTSFAYLGNMPYHYLLLFLLTFVIFTDRNKKDIFSSNNKYKFIILILIFITIILFITAIYVSFTGVGSYNIRGVQKRYLLPLLFPFSYILVGWLIKININKYLYSYIIFCIMSFILLNSIWKLCISKYN